jgi:polyhydroxybutyrate depolymerase
MKNPGYFLLAMLAIALLIGTVSCSRLAPTPTPTFTPTLTSTPMPTSTLTPIPSPTPTSTKTSLPTPTPISEPTIQPGNYTRSVKIGSWGRSYYLHIPSNISSLRPAPVVFAFHGNTMTNSDMEAYTGFTTIANQYGFLIIYPQGVFSSWNAGGCCGGAMDENIDETAFVRWILSDLETLAPIDPKRIYATGFSLGGMLVYRLACEMSDTFAAIAPVSGRLYYNPCQPQQPVSVIHIHGLSDPVVPYVESGIPDVSGFIPPPIEQGIATWAQLDGCTSSPQIEKQDIVTHTVYSSCKSGTAVELYTLDGLEHAWAQPDLWPTSTTIWEFFAAHPKP